MKRSVTVEREGDVVYETGMWAGLGMQSTIGIEKGKGRKSRNTFPLKVISFA